MTFEDLKIKAAAHMSELMTAHLEESNKYPIKEKLIADAMESIRANLDTHCVQIFIKDRALMEDYDLENMGAELDMTVKQLMRAVLAESLEYEMGQHADEVMEDAIMEINCRLAETKARKQ